MEEGEGLEPPTGLKPLPIFKIGSSSSQMPSIYFNTSKNTKQKPPESSLTRGFSKFLLG